MYKFVKNFYMAYTFIVSDESVNVYGTILETQGIDIEDFRKNPIMYYNHERNRGVIGRWENIRKDGNTLLADAVFDENTDLGAKVARQVKDGFLRSASVGFETLDMEEIDGVTHITKSKLREISIVDIPANTNAVKLAMPKNKIITLNAPIFKSLRAELITLLGLNSNASDVVILSEVKRLISECNENINMSELLDIEEEAKQTYRQLRNTNRKLYNALMDQERKRVSDMRNTLLNNALRDGRITLGTLTHWEKIAKGMKCETLALVLSSLPKQMKITNFINGKMDLAEYARFAPEELKDNPDLLRQLIDEAIATQGTAKQRKTLDWYRKNDPKFLEQNPDVYRRLIEEEMKH